MRVASSAAVVIASIGLVAGRAAADPADDAFKHGRELLKDQRYAEACAAFEASQRLDPQLGTQFNIAQCDEKIGKLATALRLYREIAERDTNAKRKATSADLAQKLAPRVPSVHIKIDPAPPGLRVTLDGAPLDLATDLATDHATATPVDFGRYTIVASAPGYKPHTETATVASEAQVVDLTIHLDAIAAPEHPPPVVGPPITGSTPASRSHRKTYATVAIGGGLAFAIGGTVFGVLARKQWNDAKAVCGGGTDTCASQADVDRAEALGTVARSRGNISTALFVAGGLAITAGVVLYATSPSEHAVQVTTQATASSAGLALSGRF